MAMIYKTAHYPRKIIEHMQLVEPECWAVYMGTESVADDVKIDDIREWAESHEYGRFIMFLHRNRTNYAIEFDREQEYTEFMMRWM